MRTLSMVALLTCLTLAVAAIPSGASADKPSLQELHQAPQEGQIEGCRVRLERAYVWRDFMPTYYAPGETRRTNGLLANLTVTAGGQPLPAGLKVLAVYIMQKDRLWTNTEPQVSADATRLEAVVRGGPTWEVGSDVEVILQLSCGDHQCLIREPGTSIHRTD